MNRGGGGSGSQKNLEIGAGAGRGPEKNSKSGRGRVGETKKLPNRGGGGVITIFKMSITKTETVFGGSVVLLSTLLRCT